jgi:hypothetical protein
VPELVEQSDAQFIPELAQIAFRVIPKIIEKEANARQLQGVFRRGIESRVSLKESEQIHIEFGLIAQAFIEKGKLDAAGGSLISQDFR